MLLIAPRVSDKSSQLELVFLENRSNFAAKLKGIEFEKNHFEYLKDIVERVLYL
jgi:hypothetical protein